MFIISFFIILYNKFKVSEDNKLYNFIYIEI